MENQWAAAGGREAAAGLDQVGARGGSSRCSGVRTDSDDTEDDGSDAGSDMMPPSDLIMHK